MADRLRKERLGCARVPSWFSGAALEFWNAYAPYLRRRGCLTRLDEAAFIVLCVTWQRMTELRELLGREGQILTSPRGRKYAHPAVSLYKAELRHFSELCKDFGLAPLPRHRIPPMQAEPEGDPLELLLARRRRVQ